MSKKKPETNEKEKKIVIQNREFLIGDRLSARLSPNTHVNGTLQKTTEDGEIVLLVGLGHYTVSPDQIDLELIDIGRRRDSKPARKPDLGETTTSKSVKKKRRKRRENH